MMPSYLIFDLEMTLIFNVNKVLSNTHVQYQVSIIKGGGVMHFFMSVGWDVKWFPVSKFYFENIFGNIIFIAVLYCLKRTYKQRFMIY